MNQERTNRILSIVHETGADAFLVFNHENSGQPGTRYLSGFSGSESVLLISEKENFIFTDGRYFSQAREECPDFNLVELGKKKFSGEFGEIAAARNLKKVVVDDTRTSHRSISELGEKFKNISVVGSENILQKIRIVKEETEIAAIRKAVSVSVKSFEELLPQIKEGINERELAWELEKLMKKNGADKISFEPIIASGVNGAKPHAKPTGKEIKKGELIIFDFGCFVDGYASDITRTVALGDVSDRLAEVYETVKTAQERGLRAVKTGVCGKEIDDACRNYISEKGFGDYFLHGTGHGLGMEVHELPNIGRGNEEPLPENSVITVEPGIYIEGFGGVRIEDDVLVKENGGVALSGALAKDLVVLN